MRIGVIGAGAWGTALARLLARAGHDVLLWAYEREVVESVARVHENTLFLAGVTLPDSLRATGDIAEAVREKDLLVEVAPSHVVRRVMAQAAPHIDGEPLIAILTKGLENDSLATMDEVLADVLPARLHGRLCAVSGPSFAREVAQDMPTVVVAAARDPGVAADVQRALATDRFRVYTSDDIVGVELGGALKNVIAIAAGASDGLGFGHNTRAALITRGLAEIARLGARKGANPLTFAGLAGMGDLLLTCTGELSRNRTVGFELGRGRKLADLLGEMRVVAEGVKTAKAARELARKVGVEMPIVELVYRVLYEDMPAPDAVNALMQRPLGAERGAEAT
ncbi:MAG: NAD(P)H-dependent glycerol-3-phosphate dehydrogenase [Myxococcota bacterium]